MQKHNLPRFLIILFTILLLTCCDKIPWSKDPKYYIVDITGINDVFNYKTLAFSGYRVLELNDTITIVVSEGDLLLIETPMDLVFRYNPDDGLS